MERGPITVEYTVETDNIEVDYSEETSAIYKMDISSVTGANIKDGETFMLSLTSDAGTFVPCCIAASVDSTTNETSFIAGDGTVIGKQSNTRFDATTRGILVKGFTRLLKASDLNDDFSFTVDSSAAAITATARETGSDAVKLVGFNLLRESNTGITGYNIKTTITKGGDRLPIIRNSSITVFDGKKIIFDFSQM